MMKTLFENELCVGCSRPINAEDDVVVCPVCGTPQHRDCWKKENRCVNHDKHSPDFEWKPSSAAADTQTAQPQPEPDTTEDGLIVCPRCHSENLPDSLHCGNCGLAFVGGEENNAQQEQAPPFTGAAVPPYMFGVYMDENDTVDGHKVGDIAAYVRTGSPRYVEKFRKMSEKSRKISWNWAAFFVSPFWFFYRKMYKAGIAFLLIMLTGALVLSVPADRFNTVYEQHYEELLSEDLSDERYYEIMEELKVPAMQTTAISGAMTLLQFFCGLYGDFLYKKQAFAEIDRLKEVEADLAAYRFLLMRKGGPSPLAFMAGWFAYQAIYSAFLYAADFFSGQ